MYNILVIKDQRAPSGEDGTSVYFRSYILELLAKGLIVTVWLEKSETNQTLESFLSDNEIQYECVDFPRIGFRKILNNIFKIYQARKQILETIKKNKIHVIDLQHHSLFHLVSKKWRVPIIVHQQGANSTEKNIIGKKRLSEIKNLHYRLKRDIHYNISKADLVVVTGEDSKRSTIEQFDYQKDNFLVSAYGTTLNIENYTELSRTGDVLTILICGRFSVAKGANDVIQVVKLILRSHPGKFKFVHIGFVDLNNPEIRKLYQIAKNYIDFCGIVNDVSLYMQKAFLLLHLSHREGGGLVVFEAKACSLPVIAWNVIGIREFIKDGFDGYLVHKGDYPSVVNIIMYLYNNDQFYYEMRKRCYAEYAQKYRFRNHVRRILVQLKELVT